MKDCNNCAYNRGTTCQVMKVKQNNCWAWTDEEEKTKREEEIKEYGKRFELEGVSEFNTSKEKLDAKFLELYKQGCHDTDIAKKLGIHASTVGDYRKKLELPYHNKRKPAVTGKIKNISSEL